MDGTNRKRQVRSSLQARIIQLVGPALPLVVSGERGMAGVNRI